MKKLIISALAMAVLLLTSCSGGGGVSNNEFLGEFPSMTKNYQQQIDQKEKAVKECTDRDEAFKLGKELNLLKDKSKEKIQEYLDAKQLKGTELPVNTISGLPYTINKAEINIVKPGKLIVKFTININEDIKTSPLFVYYKALDSKGNEIPGSKTNAVVLKDKFKTGTVYEASGGGWYSSVIANLEDFGKIQQITKEEFNKKQFVNDFENNCKIMKSFG